MNIKKYLEYEPIIHKNSYIASSVDIIGRVEIGQESNVWYQSVLRGDVAKITVGDYTNIQDGTVVHVGTDVETVIGDYVTVGHRAIIHGCTIKNHVLIGMGATVLDGAVIGENSIVGANALVTKGKVFEPGSLILGSPAKCIRKLTEDEMKTIDESAKHYVELAKNSML